MMKASPSAAFEMPEPDLLLELLIVALDPPAQLGEVDQTMQSNVLGEGREPVFGRLLLAFGPLDQQPFFRAALAAIEIAPRGANPHTGKARGQLLVRTLSPRDCAPGALRQAECEFLDRDRLMLGIPPQQLGWSSTPRPLLCRQRP